MRTSDRSSDVCSSELRGSASRAALSPFKDRSQPLPYTDAQGLKPVSHLAAAHFMKQRRGDAGTGHADGMTKRYARAVDIEHIVVTIVVAPAPGLQHRQHLRRKCFVELDEVDVAPANPRSEEHTSELQSLMRISYAVFCLKNKK